METKGKVALITGASTGIGRAAVLKFAANGYALALCDRPLQQLDELGRAIQERYGVDTLCCEADLAEETSWDTVVARTIQQWGRIDTLVNNAAWRTIETMDQITLADWEKAIRICLTAPAFLSRAAASHMKKQQHGVIVNVSSVMAERAAGYSPAYIASKGGLASLTYELATLYGPYGIRVVGVSPGNIKTTMSTDYHDATGRNVSDQLEAEMNGMTPLGRAGHPEEIANLIYWLASDDASFVTGTVVVADGGFSHNFNNYSSKKQQFPDWF